MARQYPGDDGSPLVARGFPLNVAFAQHVGEGLRRRDDRRGRALQVRDHLVRAARGLARQRVTGVVGSEHAAGGDEVRPRVAHLHDGRTAQRCTERHPGRDRGEPGRGGDHDVGPVTGAREQPQTGGQGVGGGDGLVGDAPGQPGAVLAEPDAGDVLAPLTDRAGAGAVGGVDRLERADRVVRWRGDHGEAVAARSEATGEGVPAALRRADLGRVVVRQQSDVHRLTPPGISRAP